MQMPHIPRGEKDNSGEGCHAEREQDAIGSGLSGLRQWQSRAFIEEAALCAPEQYDADAANYEQRR
jgi:hypothetical protein